MFKFNFSCDEKNDNIITDPIPSNPDPNYCKEAQEIKINTISETVTTSDLSYSVFKCNDAFEIKYVSSESVINVLKDKDSLNNPVTVADSNNSDLIAGVYEGGLKIWECTVDLINYLVSERLDFGNSIVMDLGCGAGIVGIYALIQSASCVYFQDYNSEVLEHITIPNVLINNVSNAERRAKFYSGDWKSFLKLTEDAWDSEDKKCDYIFTSETIYNPSNYEKVENVFRYCLKKTGTIYLASKCYYFGVGGSLRDFEDLLGKTNLYNYETCWTCKDGFKREILKITLKP